MNLDAIVLKAIFNLGTKALEDAGISYNQVEHACVGYVYGKTIVYHALNNVNKGTVQAMVHHMTCQ